jgi:hypothetical protein
MRSVTLPSTFVALLLLACAAAAGAGSWDWNLVTGGVEWSPRMYELLGLEPRTARASFDPQGWVIDVVLDGINRNVRGIRTALGGA